MKTEEKTISGIKYRMTQMGALSGNDVALRLARPMAAMFSEVMRAGRSGGAMLVGIERALAVLAPRDVRFIAKKLAAQTKVFLPDGNKLREWDLTPLYDEHFAGRYGAQVQFLQWGIELNAFFDDVLALPPKDAGTRFGSPTASTDGAGASSSTPSA